MMNSLAAIVIASALSVGDTSSSHSRFVVVDQSTIDEVGLRLITIRDPLRNSCYLIIRDDVTRRPGSATLSPADINEARVVRDQRLGELLRGFELDRAAIPGTIAPNPFKYDWQATTAQFEFALMAIASEFARLEQQLDRIAGGSPMTMTALPVPCASGGALTRP